MVTGWRHWSKAVKVGAVAAGSVAFAASLVTVLAWIGVGSAPWVSTATMPSTKSNDSSLADGRAIATTGGIAASSDSQIASGDAPAPSATVDPTKGPLVISKQWAMQRGCRGTTDLAMPPGHGGIESFHAQDGKTFREVLLDHGAGAWKEGTLELTLSTNGSEAVAIQRINPDRVRTDISAPRWIEDTFADCGGGGAPTRTFDWLLDPPTLLDAGISNVGGAVEGVEYLPDLLTADLGPNFVVSQGTQGRIDIHSLACEGNYEWTVDVGYTVSGDPTPYVATVGPFRTYGLASSTTSYLVFVDSDGNPEIKSSTTIEGQACDLSQLEISKPSMQDPPQLSDYSGPSERMWTHLGSKILVHADGSGSMSFGSTDSAFSNMRFTAALQSSGAINATVEESTGPGAAPAGTVLEFSLEQGADGPVLVGPDPADLNQTAYWCQPHSWDQRCGT